MIELVEVDPLLGVVPLAAGLGVVMPIVHDGVVVELRDARVAEATLTLPLQTPDALICSAA